MDSLNRKLDWLSFDLNWLSLNLDWLNLDWLSSNLLRLLEFPGLLGSDFNHLDRLESKVRLGEGGGQGEGLEWCRGGAKNHAVSKQLTLTARLSAHPPKHLSWSALTLHDSCIGG